MGADKFENCRAGWQARDLGSGDSAAASLKAAGRIPSSWVALLFYLILSTDWLGYIHIMEGNLFYSKSTDLNDNHIKKNTFISTFTLSVSFKI